MKLWKKKSPNLYECNAFYSAYLVQLSHRIVFETETVELDKTFISLLFFILFFFKIHTETRGVVAQFCNPCVKHSSKLQVMLISQILILNKEIKNHINCIVVAKDSLTYCSVSKMTSRGRQQDLFFSKHSKQPVGLVFKDRDAAQFTHTHTHTGYRFAYRSKWGRGCCVCS